MNENLRRMRSERGNDLRAPCENADRRSQNIAPEGQKWNNDLKLYKMNAGRY